MSSAENREWLGAIFSQTGSTVEESRTHILSRLRDLRIVALGEFGLDYDRLQFCGKEVQKQAFRAQLDMFSPVLNEVPLFLHSRNCADDFLQILKAFMKEKGLASLKGVVHSYTGGIEEAREYLSLGLDIGINGCSLKTQEELNVVAALPLSRLHVETDCPWCEIRRTHAGYSHLSESSQTLLRAAVKKEAYSVSSSQGTDRTCSCSAGVKSRMEPMHLLGVVDVLASVSSDVLLSGRSPEERKAIVRKQLSENSYRLFFQS